MSAQVPLMVRLPLKVPYIEANRTMLKIQFIFDYPVSDDLSAISADEERGR